MRSSQKLEDNVSETFVVVDFKKYTHKIIIKLEKDRKYSLHPY